MGVLFGHRRIETAGDKLWRVPWLVLGLTGALAAAGAATLYSVAGGNLNPWAEAHALRFLIACVAVLTMSMVPWRFWLGAAYPVYAVSLFMLALVPVFGIEALGAKRWLGAGGFSVQPSEFMKVGLLLALARYYAWLPVAETSRPLSVVVPVALVSVPVILTLQQPDLGSTVLFAALGLTLMFLAGTSVLYYGAGLTAVWLLLPLVWSGLHDYQKRRIEIFLDPEKDPLGAGYHITQSKIALGAGGIGGKGFMQGTQSQLDFLPEKHTDFIFTMFSEEWGFAGAILILSLYAALFATLILMALRTGNRFGQLVISGASMMIFLYAFINVAMVTGLVPVVGVPLPFVSYGGTSMITLMVSLGAAMSAYVHRHETVEPGTIRALW